jgi:hypothetical protein
MVVNLQRNSQICVDSARGCIARSHNSALCSIARSRKKICSAFTVAVKVTVYHKISLRWSYLPHGSKIKFYVWHYRIKLLRELEYIFKTTLAHESGYPGVPFNEKTEGRKSSKAVPLNCRLKSTNTNSNFPYIVLVFVRKMKMVTVLAGARSSGFSPPKGE